MNYSIIRKRRRRKNKNFFPISQFLRSKNRYHGEEEFREKLEIFAKAVMTHVEPPKIQKRRHPRRQFIKFPMRQAPALVPLGNALTNSMAVIR